MLGKQHHPEEEGTGMKHNHGNHDMGKHMLLMVLLSHPPAARRCGWIFRSRARTAAGACAVCCGAHVSTDDGGDDVDDDERQQRRRFPFNGPSCTSSVAREEDGAAISQCRCGG